MVIPEFQEILHESAAFVDKLRRAVEDVSTLRSSKQRLDAQRVCYMLYVCYMSSARGGS